MARLNIDHVVAGGQVTGLAFAHVGALFAPRRATLPLCDVRTQPPPHRPTSRRCHGMARRRTCPVTYDHHVSTMCLNNPREQHEATSGLMVLPTECQNGHPWSPGHVPVITQRDCPPARAARPEPRGWGHLTVECAEQARGSTWYSPPHEPRLVAPGDERPLGRQGPHQPTFPQVSERAPSGHQRNAILRSKVPLTRETRPRREVTSLNAGGDVLSHRSPEIAGFPGGWVERRHSAHDRKLTRL